jgi:hypothetical protein
MENAGIFYGPLKYSTLIWYILWPFGNVVVIWYIFPRFGKLCQEKSGNPDANPTLQSTSHVFTFSDTHFWVSPCTYICTQKKSDIFFPLFGSERNTL